MKLQMLVGVNDLISLLLLLLAVAARVVAGVAEVE